MNQTTTTPAKSLRDTISSLVPEASRPRLWRCVRIVVAIVSIGALTAITAGCTAEQSKVNEYLNNDRYANGLPQLLLNASASDAPGGAQAHADWMRDTRTLAHASNISIGWPSGWRKAGENVGVGGYSGNVDADVAAVERAFMGSAGHRANILDTSFNQSATGYSVGSCPTTPNWAKTPQCIYVTQRFAAY